MADDLVIVYRSIYLSIRWYFVLSYVWVYFATCSYLLDPTMLAFFSGLKLILWKNEWNLPFLLIQLVHACTWLFLSYWFYILKFCFVNIQLRHSTCIQLCVQLHNLFSWSHGKALPLMNLDMLQQIWTNTLQLCHCYKSTLQQKLLWDIWHLLWLSVYSERYNPRLEIIWKNCLIVLEALWHFSFILELTWKFWCYP